MKKLMLVVAAAVLATGAFAAPKVKSAAKPAAPKTAVCPVTGEKIAAITSGTLKSTYKGKTYYFCCAGCKPKFDASPAKYIRPAAKKTTGGMKMGAMPGMK